MIGGTARLAPARGVRLREDPVRGGAILLAPERGVRLSASAAAVVRRCDGGADVDTVVAELVRTHGGPRERIERDARALLGELLAHRLLVEIAPDGATTGRERASARLVEASGERSATQAVDDAAGAPPPTSLVAELTYRCPLRCAYCSNPTSVADRGRPPLAVRDWLRVIDEAAALGVLHVHFTGGEPLLFGDLEALIARAAARGIYSNLITSAVPLARERLVALRGAGLEHVQISFQSRSPVEAETVAGLDALAAKRAACGWARDLGIPLTVNVVLHRRNLDGLEGLVALAEEVGADRLELAHVQLAGWAMENRDALLPTSSQIAHARAVTRAARARLGDRLEIVAVLPDHHAAEPRACMDGWGRRTVVVAPDGLALPCHAARDLPLAFQDVRDAPLGTIWAEGPAFRAFRGEGWMPEPCRSCDRRGIDHGGCRCRAFALTGDAAATDPACGRAPDHALVARAVAATDAGDRRDDRLRLRRLPVA